MSPQFCVIIPMFNVADAIGENIAALRRQSYPGFRCVLVDDLSTDGTPAAVQAEIAGDSRFELVTNDEKKYALRNAVEAIGAACEHDDEIIVPVDGDDQLMHKDVLAHVAEVYATRDCWLTYGSYANERGERGRECSPYPKQILERGSFRRSPWRASHLKTFRFGLWRHVPAEAFRATPEEQRAVCRLALMSGRLRSWWYWQKLDTRNLHDATGRCFRRCYDKAIMYPMLELAGLRSQFISEELYRYHSGSPAAGEAPRPPVVKWGTRCIQDILRHKPSLTPLATGLPKPL